MSRVFVSNSDNLEEAIDKLSHWNKKKSKRYLRSRNMPFSCTDCGRGMHEHIFKTQKENKLKPKCSRCWLKHDKMIEHKKGTKTKIDIVLK